MDSISNFMKVALFLKSQMKPPLERFNSFFVQEVLWWKEATIFSLLMMMLQGTWPDQRIKIFHHFSKCGSYSQFLDLSHNLLVCKFTHLEYPRLLLMWSHGFDTSSHALIVLICNSLFIMCYLINLQIYDSP